MTTKEITDLAVSIAVAGGNKVVLTGSIAILLQGYELNRPIKDIDILLTTKDVPDEVKALLSAQGFELAKNEQQTSSDDAIAYKNAAGLKIEFYRFNPGGERLVSMFTEDDGEVDIPFLLLKDRYFVSAIEEIMKAKFKYLLECNESQAIKCHYDITFILSQMYAKRMDELKTHDIITKALNI